VEAQAGVIAAPAFSPAASYEEGITRARAIMQHDDQRIAPAARTLLLDSGKRVPWCVVLFHGLTNHPGQYVEFAPQLAELGANVLVPRMPLHGYANRMTGALAHLTAEMLLRRTYEAVDAAAGLGERVAVLGISMGGLLCAHLAQYRADVAASVPVAPDFGLLNLSRGVTAALSVVVNALPNMFLWWDPRIKEAQRPKDAYPRFSTHALMQTVRIGNAVFDAARTAAPLAGRIATVVNERDPAVNNRVTLQVVDRWQRLRKTGIDYVSLAGLPENHDLIDPDNPQARTNVVYPKLIEILALHS
jgi:alpha-beta hydrolase superfamily lysophospholipase